MASSSCLAVVVVSGEGDEPLLVSGKKFSAVPGGSAFIAPMTSSDSSDWIVIMLPILLSHWSGLHRRPPDRAPSMLLKIQTLAISSPELCQAHQGSQLRILRRAKSLRLCRRIECHAVAAQRLFRHLDTSISDTRALALTKPDNSRY